MILSVISFSDTGSSLAEKLQAYKRDGWSIETVRKPSEGLSAWTQRQFYEKKALIFIGACGIAVRSIAPYIKDKLQDSPVIVIDEKGRYVIPILSGHVGGGNEIAQEIADYLETDAVITTATDINHKFSVDVFARRNHLTILNKDGIVNVSSAILQGRKIRVSVEGDRWGSEELPNEIEKVSYPPQNKIDVVISTEEAALEKGILRLKPKQYILGVGCKRGKTEEELEKFWSDQLNLHHIGWEDVRLIASIDRKKDEEGILNFTRRRRIEYQTFSEEKLSSIEGDFSSSEFVKKVIGVDNVCERAAVAAGGEKGRLILRKQAEDGMTLAIVKGEWNLDWKGWKSYEA